MRREKLFAGLGALSEYTALEIGALDKPILTKKEMQVTYVDYADTETLKRNYASSLDHDANNIVEVDSVWGDKNLANALGDGVQVDFVLASHVIEHVPDFITWFQEICSVLKPNGTVRLAIPDRRYCFDIRRRDSTISEAVYSYILRARKPLPYQVLDFGLHFFAIDCVEAWSGKVKIPEIIGDEQVEHGIAVAKAVMESGEYFDIHCWVFTPHSFARLLQQLTAVGLVALSCKHWYDTARNELEFFIIMEKCEDRDLNAASWREMALAVEGSDLP